MNVVRSSGRYLIVPLEIMTYGRPLFRADPTGCDQAFMLRGLRGVTLSVVGYNYKGRVLRLTKNLPSEFKTSRFNIRLIQTGDISGAVSATCGQAWFIDTDDTAFGHITHALPNWDTYGPVFQNTIDVSWTSIEGGWRENSGLEFRGCASVWGLQAKFGNESGTLPALIKFTGSISRRCWNIHLVTVSVIDALNGVVLENVGLDPGEIEMPGITIERLLSHRHAGAGLKTTNCANVSVHHDSYLDRVGLETTGALTDSHIKVDYFRNTQEAIIIGSGGGNGLRLSGTVKEANVSGTAGKFAINIASLENIDAKDLIVSGHDVVDLIRLLTNNNFRMVGGSLTVAGPTVKFGGSQPRLADGVRGYVNTRRASATIFAGQTSVVVTHGMDVAPAFIFLQVRNSDANGSRARPSSIGATTFAIQTISGSVSSDSVVDYLAIAGNAP